MTSSIALTASQLFDLFAYAEQHYARTSTTHRADLADTLDAFDNDMTQLIDSYIREMCDELPIVAEYYNIDIDYNDDDMTFYDATRALTDDEYDALIALITAYYSDMIAS